MNVNIYNRNVKYKDGVLIGFNYSSIFTPISFYLYLESIATKKFGAKYARKLIDQLTGAQSETAGSWWLKFGFARRMFVKFGRDNLESTGMGPIHKFEFNGDDVIVHVSSNFAKEYVKIHGKAKKPVCTYYESLLNGPLIKMFGLNPVKERKCMAKGDDCCVFKS